MSSEGETVADFYKKAYEFQESIQRKVLRNSVKKTKFELNLVHRFGKLTSAYKSQIQQLQQSTFLADYYKLYPDHIIYQVKL